MSNTESAVTGAGALGRAHPILRVRSLQASLDYYVNVLGFKVDWQAPGVIASVSRDQCCVFLCEGDQGHAGGWIWVGVGDIEPLCAELRAKGAKIRHPPTNHWWAYEMQIEDPDGNVLRIGSERRQDRPDGEWLDMRGNRWVGPPGGGSARVEDG